MGYVCALWYGLHGGMINWLGLASFLFCQKTSIATRGNLWDWNLSSVHEANEVSFPWPVAPLYHSAEAVNKAPKNPSFTGDNGSLASLKS